MIVGGIQLGKVFDIEMTAALQRVEKMGAGTVSVIGCIVSVILIVISYKNQCAYHGEKGVLARIKGGTVWS